MPASAQTHRPAAVAGQFYPANPAALRAQLAAWRDSPAPAASGVAGAPKLLIVPHAGYVYSGAVAARAYALLAPQRTQIRRVVLLGPAHRVAVNGLAMPTVAAFDTPLGSVPLDQAALAALAGLPAVMVSDAAHVAEHALEVQLPFLQDTLAGFTLAPLAVGRARPEQVAQVLERLWGGPETLIVISTDLSHFLPYGQARARDGRTIQRLLALDATLNHEEACGATPVNGALLAASRHGLTPELLEYRNSGDTAGDRARVVGYAALAFWPPSPSPSVRSAGPAEPEAAALGAALLARARNAIASRLGLPLDPEPPHPALQRPGATFVTLYREGRLRGCIGRLEAGEDTLETDVRRNARRAAFEDPRFAPLTVAEWTGLTVEVSVLDAPEALEFASEAEALAQLRPGVDGVILTWRRRQATFLPQVWAQLPETRAFMVALKRKAGLADEFWAPDVQLARYRVQSFTEAQGACP